MGRTKVRIKRLNSEIVQYLVVAKFSQYAIIAIDMMGAKVRMDYNTTVRSIHNIARYCRCMTHQ